MLEELRSVPSYQLGVAELTGLSIVMGTPGLDDLASIASWPVMLFSKVCLT